MRVSRIKSLRGRDVILTGAAGGIGRKNSAEITRAMPAVMNAHCQPNAAAT